MENSDLSRLITCLTYGTKLHIGALFFGNFGNERLHLPYDHTIHASPMCVQLKNLPNGYRRCYTCRNMAIRKAVATKQAFGGLCINGVYEYTRPIVVKDTVVGIIFIGNILMITGNKRQITADHPLADTMEQDFSFYKCHEMAGVMEQYIKMTLEQYPAAKKTAAFDPLVENLKKYIEENLEYEIDLTLLAKIFHYNEKYLGRLFKQKTGISVCAYVLQRRLDRAKKLLRDTNDTVLAISEKTGFRNVTYFNRMFKLQEGITPTHFRAIHHK